ncbi:hypothetical protein [Balneola sp. EhC07]|nr:hypothetical protein [Balneola sp. EhC07]
MKVAQIHRNNYYPRYEQTNPRILVAEVIISVTFLNLSGIFIGNANQLK